MICVAVIVAAVATVAVVAKILRINAWGNCAKLLVGLSLHCSGI